MRDPFDGRVVGVVDLSGLIDIFRPHNTALVALAAQEIEGAMERRQNQQRARLLEAFLGSRLNTGHEDGVILLDRLGRVIYARRAPERAQIAGVERDIRLGLRLLGLSERMSETPISWPRCRKVCGPATSARLRIDGELSGAALVFRRRSRRDEGRRQAYSAGRTRRAADRRAQPGAARGDRAGSERRAQRRRGTRRRRDRRRQGAVRAPASRRARSQAERAVRPGQLRCHRQGAVRQRAVRPHARRLHRCVARGPARQVRAGRRRRLCLDEIGEMPLDIQPYLLRVMEDRIVYRIGDGQGRPGGR